MYWLLEICNWLSWYMSAYLRLLGCCTELVVGIHIITGGSGCTFWLSEYCTALVVGIPSFVITTCSLSLSLCMRARVCVRACVRACACLCVCVCVCVCVRVRTRVIYICCFSF